MLSSFAVFAAAVTIAASPAAPPAEPLPPTAELPPLFAPLPEATEVSNNCFIRCDNGINVDGWDTSCQGCLDSAIANCNQQGTYGGQMWFTGAGGCSYFW